MARVGRSAQGSLGGKKIVDLGLGVRDGRYSLGGTLGAVGTAPRQAPAPDRAPHQGAGRGDARRPQAQRPSQPRLARLAIRGRRHGRPRRRRASPRSSLDVKLLKPSALFPNMTGRDVHLHATLEGPYGHFAYRYALASPHVAFDTTGFDNLRATGEGRWSKAPVALPIRLQAAQVTGVGTVAGGILRNLSVAGVLRIDAKQVVGQDLALTRTSSRASSSSASIWSAGAMSGGRGRARALSDPRARHRRRHNQGQRDARTERHWARSSRAPARRSCGASTTPSSPASPAAIRASTRG